MCASSAVRTPESGWRQHNVRLALDTVSVGSVPMAASMPVATTLPPDMGGGTPTPLENPCAPSLSDKATAGEGRAMSVPPATTGHPSRRADTDTFPSSPTSCVSQFAPLPGADCCWTQQPPWQLHSPAHDECGPMAPPVQSDTVVHCGVVTVNVVGSTSVDALATPARATATTPATPAGPAAGTTPVNCR